MSELANRLGGPDGSWTGNTTAMQVEGELPPVPDPVAPQGE